MHSPLPDATALEQGILEDERPSRLSRVQDNVRHLLRSSVLSSTRGSILISPPPLRTRPPRDVHPLASPIVSPIDRNHADYAATPEDLPRGSQQYGRPIRGRLFPPLRPRTETRLVAQLSGTTLNHPDLMPAPLAYLAQQKAIESQRSQEPRKRRHHRRRYYRRSRRRCDSHWLICILSTILLFSIVATYIALNACTPNLAGTFHILFVLGILCALVLFLHSILRMCMFNRGRDRSTRFYIVAKDRKPRHGHHRSRQPSDDSTRTRPIQDENVDPLDLERVHLQDEEEVQPDPHDSHPMAGVEIPHDSNPDKPARAVTNPPPAYGRWRGSVRVDPQLLHWQVASPHADPQTPPIPSPTYEQAMSSPPTYVSRPSPPRRAQLVVGDPLPAFASEPEMVEAPGADGHV